MRTFKRALFKEVQQLLDHKAPLLKAHFIAIRAGYPDFHEELCNLIDGGTVLACHPPP